jgi:hypothetical protein
VRRFRILFTTPTLELKVASRDPLLLSLIILPIAIPLKEVKEPAIILPSGCINEQYPQTTPKLNEASTVPSGFNRPNTAMKYH